MQVFAPLHLDPHSYAAVVAAATAHVQQHVCYPLKGQCCLFVQCHKRVCVYTLVHCTNRWHCPFRGSMHAMACVQWLLQRLTLLRSDGDQEGEHRRCVDLADSGGG